MSDASNPATAIGFKLKIDPVAGGNDPSQTTSMDLGLWTSVEGLTIETGVEKRKEGGDNLVEHKFPTRVTYGDVKLGRVLSRESGKVARWFLNMGQLLTKTNAQITAIDADGKEIVSWQLIGVIPVRWNGPSFSVDQHKPATESLTLTFERLNDAAQPAGSQPRGSISAPSA